MADDSPAATNAVTDPTPTPTPTTPAPPAVASPASPAVVSAAASPSSSVGASPASAPAASAKPSPIPSVSLQRSEPPKNLRGLNKPKCIKCGNVARSRCPYQSCKSCCSKAQNPCHIHVLKPNATLADRSPSNSSHSEPPPIEASSSGPGSRPASIRQLSSTFAQFNNVHIPLRSRKPLTRKDAITINEWRFTKLKEFRDGNIEAENEAFDRYMQNISLLEEVFDLEATTPMDNSYPALDHVEKAKMLSGMKAVLRSDPIRSDKFRKRIQNIVQQGLVKLKKRDKKHSNGDHNDGTEHDPTSKKAKISEDDKASPLSQLNDKINKARNEDDLNLCLQLMSQLTGHSKGTPGTGSLSTENSEVQAIENSLPDYSPQKLVKTHVISQEALNKIDLHFSSLEEIEDL